MTIKQKIVKTVYPFFQWINRRRLANTTDMNTENIKAPEDFYSLSAELNTGKPLSFDKLRGKKVLLVNTASDCGFTPQYAELQKLYGMMKDELEIIGFPSNDFGEQEKGSDAEIAQFCQVNYGVSFPLTKKMVVAKKEGQHPVFEWLSQEGKNGWNDKAPSWNFTKFLINEEGQLTHHFAASVSPLAEEVMAALKD